MLDLYVLCVKDKKKKIENHVRTINDGRRLGLQKRRLGLWSISEIPYLQQQKKESSFTLIINLLLLLLLFLDEKLIKYLLTLNKFYYLPTQPNLPTQTNQNLGCPFRSGYILHNPKILPISLNLQFSLSPLSSSFSANCFLLLTSYLLTASNPSEFSSDKFLDSSRKNVMALVLL